MRGDQEEAGGPPSAEECAQFVRLLLSGLSSYDAANGESDEHGRLMQALAEIIRSEHANGDQAMSMGPSAAPPPGYNSRLGVRGSDRRNGRAHDRAIAQDSAIAAYAFRAEQAWWIAGLAGLIVGSVWNYAVSSVFTWTAR